MYKISAAQSKAGRAFLEWSQEDLAKKANLSTSTVRSFENGIVLRINTIDQICKTLEQAGIEFTEGGGVRPRSDAVRIYIGNDSCDQFFDNVMHTIRTTGGNVACVAQTQEMVIRSFGVTQRNRLERMEILNKVANIRCIIPEASSTSLIHSVQFRTLSKQQMGPWSYYVYGDKYAHIIQEGPSNFCFVVFHKPLEAYEYNNHFSSLWNLAAPLKISTGFQENILKVACQA